MNLNIMRCIKVNKKKIKMIKKMIMRRRKIFEFDQMIVGAMESAKMATKIEIMLVTIKLRDKTKSLAKNLNTKL